MTSRKIPVYQLLPYKTVLAQLLSFSANVERCNFTTVTGWGGKTYVDALGHNVDEHKSALRGVEVLDVYYLKREDYVILTEEQLKDLTMIMADDATRHGCEFTLRTVV
jgi:hypothetical protein